MTLKLTFALTAHRGVQHHLKPPCENNVRQCITLNIMNALEFDIAPYAQVSTDTRVRY
jgi:predicted type IV restriction endonuclease